MAQPGTAAGVTPRTPAGPARSAASGAATPEVCGPRRRRTAVDSAWGFRPYGTPLTRVRPTSYTGHNWAAGGGADILAMAGLLEQDHVKPGMAIGLADH